MSRSDQSELRTLNLEDENHSVTFLNLGATTIDWQVDDRPIILGYKDLETYRANPIYAGAIVGRVANRIAGGKFSLNRQSYQISQNEGRNTLHGGAGGISKQIWNMEIDSRANQIQFSLNSPDGDQGFPAAVDFEVIATLKNGRLTYDMSARPDVPTPISMAQHNYYNLAGQGAIWDHALQLNASAVTPVDAEGIPLGIIEPLDGQHFDFRTTRRIADQDLQRQGIDLNFVLNGQGMRRIASLKSVDGFQLDVVSDQSAAQLYTGAGIPHGIAFSNGQESQPFAGLCIEPQGYPNAVNEPSFPTVITTPDAPYSQRLELILSS